MSIIAARIYRDGRLLTDVDLAKPIPRLERKEDFVWIGLHDPDGTPDWLRPVHPT